MTVLFYLAAGVLVALVAATALVRMEPRRAADTLRLAGPVAIGLVGVALVVFGRVGVGGALVSLALAWYLSGRNRRRARATPGRHSTVRTAALEMELDHDSGSLEGLILVGPMEGRTLGSMQLGELLELAAQLSSDQESIQLLEAYLDSRFPLWRDDPQANRGGGQGGAPASGPMTKEEAHKILGLEAGASAAEIRKAHRRLMQRLHPDLGGSSFLAARINEAKDVLLSGHR